MVWVTPTSGEMQSASHFIMLVPTYQTIQHHKPVNYTLNICYFEKLRSHLLSTNSYAGEGKGHPITGHQRPRGGNRGIALLILNLCARRGVGGQHHASATLPLGKTQHALYRKLSGPQGRSGCVRKILSPLGFNPWTVQPVVSRYTDQATRPAHVLER
jgi:hypothetical protein